MAKCEQCGNEYSHAFTVTMDGTEHTYDSFECAITALAPQCACCSCRIIGHGVTHAENIFCCDHCARSSHQAAGS